MPAACFECGKGPPEVEFKWRTDVKSGGWRGKCNECVNAKGYHKTHRSKKMAENADAYRAHNAAVHLEWAHRNPERVKLQQEKTACEPKRKIATIRTSCIARDIDFADEDASLMMAKLEQACHYCAGIPNDGERLNGLDRVDSEKGYTDANTVPCCPTCNAMKGPFSVDVFLSNVRAIYAHLGDVERSSSRVRTFGGHTELRYGPTRHKHKDDLLTVDRKIELWSAPCYLCGRSPSFGIDRLDASGDYTPENSRSCCTDCNYMKKDAELGAFASHVDRVAQHTSRWVIKDVSSAPLVTFGGKTRHPVAVDVIGGTLVFPSVTTAARVVERGRTTLLDVLESKTGSIYAWMRADVRAYRLQQCTQERAAAAIRELRKGI
jgi:hypothetical protein